MKYSSFNRDTTPTTDKFMFLDNNPNVARYDIQKFVTFEKLTEKQLSFFWSENEIDVSRDRAEFANLPKHEQHIFLSNLKYQILLDSIEARSVNIAFLPVVSLTEIESLIEVIASFEVIHSRAYSHLIRNVFVNPSEVFDEIMVNDAILERAESIGRYYDDLIEYNSYYNLFGYGTHLLNGKEIIVDEGEHIKKIILAIVTMYCLESIRFIVSFCCSFAFSERKLMVGNGKLITLISRDEMLHVTFAQTIINNWVEFKDDSRFSRWWYELIPEIRNIFQMVAEQEFDWADYLFKDGSMLGLNDTILKNYVKYIVNLRMTAIGLEPIYDIQSNPIPWVNSYYNSSETQSAPQEVEMTSYLVGAVDASLAEDDFSDFEL